MRKAQEQELTTLLGTAKNKTAAKIKRMLLIHKHMVAMEQMRFVFMWDLAKNIFNDGTKSMFQTCVGFKIIMTC